MGIVSLINSKSGETLDRLEKSTGILKREEADSKNRMKKSYEVTVVIFNEEQKLVFTASCDSIVRLYKLDTHVGEKLREFQGGHNSSEITAADYCPQTLMLYTGAANGTIAMWSVETSSLTNVLRESSDEITAIKNLFPYPAIFVGDSRGILNCWRAKEISTVGSIRQKTRVGDVSWLIFSIHIKSQSLNQQLSPIRSIITFMTSEHHEFHHQQIQVFEYDQLVSARKTLLPNLRVGFASHDENQTITDANRPGLDSAVFESQLQLNLKLKRQFTGMKSTSITLGSEEDIKAKKNTHLIAYCASQSGTITGFDIDLLLRGNIEKLSELEYNTHRWERFHTNIYRHDHLDGRRTFIAFLKEERSSLGFMLSPARVFLDVAVCSISWTAHYRRLNSITAVEQPLETIISCSESELRIWGLLGQQYCNVNMLTLRVIDWNIPYNFLNNVLQKLESAVDMLAHITNQSLANTQREQYIAKFIWCNYLWPQIQSDRKEVRVLQQQEDRKKRFAIVQKKYNQAQKKSYKNLKSGLSAKDLDISNLSQLEKSIAGPTTPMNLQLKKLPSIKDPKKSTFEVSESEESTQKVVQINSGLAKQLNTKFNQIQFEVEEQRRHQQMENAQRPKPSQVQKSLTMQIGYDVPVTLLANNAQEDLRLFYPKSMPLHQNSFDLQNSTPQSRVSDPKQPPEGPTSLKLLGNITNKANPSKRSVSTKKRDSLTSGRGSIVSDVKPPPGRTLQKAQTMFAENNDLIHIIPVDPEPGQTDHKTRNVPASMKLPEELRSKSAVSRTRNTRMSVLVTTNTNVLRSEMTRRISGLPRAIVPSQGKIGKLTSDNQGNYQPPPTLGMLAASNPRPGSRTRGVSLDSLVSRVHRRYNNTSSVSALSSKRSIPQQSAARRPSEQQQQHHQHHQQQQQTQPPAHPQGPLTTTKGFFVRGKTRLRGHFG